MVVAPAGQNVAMGVAPERSRTAAAGEQCVFGTRVKAGGAISPKTHIIVFGLQAPMLIDHLLDAGAKKPTRGRFVARVGVGRSPHPNTRRASANFTDRKDTRPIHHRVV